MKFHFNLKEIVLKLIGICVKSSWASICLLFNQCLNLDICTDGQPTNIDWAKAKEWYKFECRAQFEPIQYYAFKQRFRHSYLNINKTMEYDRFNWIKTLKWKKAGNRETSMPNEYSNIPFGGLFDDNQSEFNIIRNRSVPNHFDSFIVCITIIHFWPSDQNSVERIM